jgi:glucosamine--fructose-6-phosphate aminotransferase (isomerizing)
MLILALCLVKTLAHDEVSLTRLQRLPQVLEEILVRAGPLPQQLGEDLAIDNMFFLGSGPLYGVANEAMLKTKEMSLSTSEAYHPMEFRHGPMSMVNESTLVIGLLSDTGLEHEHRVLEHMQRLGGRTLAILEDARTSTAWTPNHFVELKSGLEEWERSPLFLPVLQRMAFHRARAKGLDPDQPMHLTAVVQLKDSESSG